METILRLRKYLISWLTPLIISFSGVLIFSFITPFHNSPACKSDLDAPLCTSETKIVDYSEEKGVHYIDLEIPAFDDCTKELEARFYLDSEVEIESSVILPYGTHWIQSRVRDEAGNVSICEFQVIVLAPGDNAPDFNEAEPILTSLSDKEPIRTREPSVQFELGNLSMYWESGKKGSGVISKSRNDPGGPSYGLYQISLKKGYLEDFLENEGSYFRSILGPHSPGSSEFNKVWNQLSVLFPAEFQKAQHEYIERTHYKKYALRIKYQLDLDVNKYSNVLKEVVWSTAVQHGPYTDVFYNALVNHDLEKMSEEDVVRRVYAERSRIEDGQLVYFPRVGDRWQENLLQRFRSEEEMALSGLGIVSPSNLNEPVADGVDATEETDYEESKEDIASNEPIKTINKEPFHVKESVNTYPQEPLPTTPEVTPVVNESAEPKLNDTEGTVEEGVIDDVQIKEDSKVVDQTEAPKAEVVIAPKEIMPEKSTVPAKNVENYRVLFVILKDTDVAFPDLDGMGEIFENANRSNQVRYFIGKESNIDEARSLQTKIKSLGYRAASLAKFKGDKLVRFLD